MESTPIDRIVERARGGDRDAAGRLLTEWQAELAGFVRRRAGPGLLAKESRIDIIQSACREVLAAMPGAEIEDGAEGFKAWLFRATLHKIIDRHRYWGAHKRDQKREDGRAWSQASVDRLADSFASPSSVAEREEMSARIRSVLEALPAHYECVLRLCHFENLPHREVAERVGRTEEATRSLLARAMARLTRLVHQELGD